MFDLYDIIKKYVKVLIIVQIVLSMITLPTLIVHIVENGNLNSFASYDHPMYKRNILDNNMTITDSTIQSTTMPIIFTTTELNTNQDMIVRGCVDKPNNNITCTDYIRQRTLTMFLLAFFVGMLGVARCVAGYWCCGVFQCLTCGGCGIWALVDWICILAVSWVSSYNGCCFLDNMGL